MKRLFCLLTVLMLCGGCMEQPTSAQRTALPDISGLVTPEHTFGLLVPNLEEETLSRLTDGLRSAIEEKGDQLLVYSCEDDLYLQLDQAEYLAEQQVDGVFLIPADTGSMKSALDAFRASSIPVVNLDRRVKHGEIAAYVGTGEADLGQVAAGLLRQQFPGGCRATIFEDSENPALRTRMSAFYSGMKGSGFYFTAAEQIRDDTQVSYEKARGMIENGVMVDAIICASDRMALAVAKAYDEAPASLYRPLIYGMGGSPEATEAVRTKRLTAVIHKQLEQSAATAAVTMYAILDGSPYEKDTLLPPEILRAGA